MINSPYESYVLYLALKMHFDTKNNYDFFKYSGKVKANVESFFKRKDSGYFYKFENIKDLKDYFIGNFLVDNNMWIGDFTKDNANNYKKQLKHIDYNLTNIIESGIKKWLVYNNSIGVNEIVIISALDIIMNGKIISIIDKKNYDPLLWPDIKQKIILLKPFIIEHIGINNIVKYQIKLRNKLITN